jgi:hypothetical protein
VRALVVLPALVVASLLGAARRGALGGAAWDELSSTRVVKP